MTVDKIFIISLGILSFRKINRWMVANFCITATCTIFNFCTKFIFHILMKKRRGRNESDDDFVPGKLALRKAKGNMRGKKKEGGGSDDDSEELEEELFEPETEEESLHFSPSSSEEELESDGTVYEPKGRNAKRAAALKGGLIIYIFFCLIYLLHDDDDMDQNCASLCLFE